MSQTKVKPSALVYDIEIENCIPDKVKKKDPRFNYCVGWHDHIGMGIACVGVYDLYTSMPRVFTKGNMGDLQKLILDREEIIGLNSLDFDDKVLLAHGINIKTTYDIMVEARSACGVDKFTKGFSLAKLLSDNNLASKTGSGELAPVQWQMGQYGAVIDYCLADVMLTYRLLLKRANFHVGTLNRTVKLREPKCFSVINQEPPVVNNNSGPEKPPSAGW